MSHFVRSESGLTSLNLPESSLMIESRAALVPFMGCSRSKTGSLTHMMPVIALIIAFIFKVPGACVAAFSEALLLWALPVVQFAGACICSARDWTEGARALDES